MARSQKTLRGKEDSPENLGLAGLKNKTISNLQLLHLIKDSQIKTAWEKSQIKGMAAKI